MPVLLAEGMNGIPKPPGIIDDLGAFISGIIQLLFLIAALATFLYLVMGGIQWITSGGDSKKTEAAGKQITNALIGLAIVAVSWAVMALVAQVFHINIFNWTLPNFFKSST